MEDEMEDNKNGITFICCIYFVSVLNHFNTDLIKNNEVNRNTILIAMCCPFFFKLVSQDDIRGVAF